MKRIMLGLIISFVVAIAPSPARADLPSELGKYVELRAGGDEQAVASYVAELRKAGPTKLNELLAARDALLGPLASFEIPGAIESTQEVVDLDRLIDAVGGQRYCTRSRLFWHTDLAAAQYAAAQSGKPILSLRMLGKLTEELSCANSRFFRTTLYANQEIAELLSERFVLHWVTVRPVPVITIEFGDGRRIVRTITGNSAHYVLDADGRPIDCLPGLHGPQAFQDWLISMDGLTRQLRQADDPARESILADHHRSRLDSIKTAWQADLLSLGRLTDIEDEPRSEAPERIVLTELMTDETWVALGELHRGDVSLDNTSRALIRNEQPAVAATRIAMTKSLIEAPVLDALFDRLEHSVAVDTIRNEYELHSQIHEWYLSGSVSEDAGMFNRQVYAVLFLMPDDDPWLGLVDPNVYTGVSNAGIVYDAP